MHWNVIDQFMIRASLVPAFNTGGIRVLTRVGDYELVSGTGRPLAAVSDHLPVLLELDLDKK